MITFTTATKKNQSETGFNVSAINLKQFPLIKTPANSLQARYYHTKLITAKKVVQ